MQNLLAGRLLRRLPEGQVFWLLLLAFVAAGDYYEWQSTTEMDGTLSADPFTPEHVDQWMPTCYDHSLHGNVCHVVLSFWLPSSPAKKRIAILGFSRNHATITAPIERLTMTSWRVDGHPFADTVSTQGDGAILSRRNTAVLIAQMLGGKHLKVRFVEPGTDTTIERSFPLDGFPKAYARYQRCSSGAGAAMSGEVAC